MTPASIAHAALPKSRDSRAPAMQPVTRQQSKESKDSSKKKNGFFSNVFRRASTRGSHEVWHPPTSEKPTEGNRSQSSLQSSLQSTGKAQKLPSGSVSTTKNIDVDRSRTQRRMPPPIAVDIPLPAQGRKDPGPKVFSAFKLLHTKRDRTMSHASVEAQDGMTQTAVSNSVTLAYM